jgi:16S rRNA (guanine1516-N2)-methyltransferase
MNLDLINLGGIESKRLNELETQLNLISNDTINLDRDSLVLQEDNLYFNFKKERALTPLKIDIKKGALGWRLARAQHETHLKKAIGKTDQPLRILDATAGLLRDSMIMLALGHSVTAYEQSKILYTMLNNELNQLSETDSNLLNFQLINSNVCETKFSEESFDVIYFDPMYPEDRASSARRSDLKKINSILEIEGLASEPESTFTYLRNIPSTKLIVKRPLKADAFEGSINYQITGKSVRFDIYLN